MIRILVEDCTGCGLCVKACLCGALEVEDKVARFIEENCTYCAVCVQSCPTRAVKLERKAVTEDVSAFKGVWIFAEQFEGKLRNVGLELLGKGRELANRLGEDLCAVIIGPEGSQKLCSTLSTHGADKIYLVESEACTEYSTDAFTDALSILIMKYKPGIMLFGATHVGRDLAPSVAGDLGLGLTADCTALSIEDKDNLLLQTRPAFGGNVMADIVCLNTRPQMATVRPNVMPMPVIEVGRECEIVREKIPLNPKRIRTKTIEILRTLKRDAKSVEESDFVISGGKGIGEDGFAMLEELASLLDGAVGCSRPMVEKGLMPKAAQVGQSGKTISPRVYFAIGISGCIQHEVGIRSSDYIVAINSNPDAPIFELADFGIVGDAQEVVPLLIEALKNKG